MERTWKLVLRIVFVSILVNIALATQAQVKINRAPEQTIQVPARAPHAFLPFTLKDPVTGRVMPGSTVLTVDGQTMTATAYIQKLNAAEKQLNALGYSLHDGDEVVLDSSPDQADLVKQNDANELQGKAPVPNAAHQNAAPPGAPGGGGGAGAIGGGESTNTKSVSYEVGSRSSLDAKAYATLTTTASLAALNMTGDAGCSAGILGHEWTLAQASGQIGHTGAAFTERFKLTIAGSTLVDQSLNGGSIYKKSDDWSTSTQCEGSFTIPLGPVPLHCKLGLSGKIGAGWSVDVQATSIKGTVSPHAELTGYGEVSLDVNLFILRVSAGVNVSITFVSYNGALTGSCNLGYDTGGGFYVDTDVNYTHEITLLSGRVSAFVQVKVWLFTWHTKRWTWTLWNWDGWHDSGQVFDVSKRLYLGVF